MAIQFDNSNTGTVTLKPPASGSVALVLPSADGTSGQVISTDGSGNLSFTTAGKVKAWVNFNGTGTVAIRAGYNVSSITDNGTGDYTVNFTTVMADVNYTAVASSDSTNSNSPQGMVINFGTAINDKVSPTTSALRVSCWVLSSGAGFDNPYINVTVFS